MMLAQVFCWLLFLPLYWRMLWMLVALTEEIQTLDHVVNKLMSALDVGRINGGNTTPRSCGEQAFSTLKYRHH